MPALQLGNGALPKQNRRDCIQPASLSQHTSGIARTPLQSFKPDELYPGFSCFRRSHTNVLQHFLGLIKLPQRDTDHTHSEHQRHVVRLSLVAGLKVTQSSGQVSLFKDDARKIVPFWICIVVTNGFVKTGQCFLRSFILHQQHAIVSPCLCGSRHPIQFSSGTGDRIQKIGMDARDIHNRSCSHRAVSHISSNCVRDGEDQRNANRDADVFLSPGTT